jgi:hypothetical protein
MARRIMIAVPPIQLPDDIEQKLLDGQRLRATHDLMMRRGISLGGAQVLIGRWLFDRLAGGNPAMAMIKRRPGQT